MQCDELNVIQKYFQHIYAAPCGVEYIAMNPSRYLRVDPNPTYRICQSILDVKAMEFICLKKNSGCEQYLKTG